VLVAMVMSVLAVLFVFHSVRIPSMLECLLANGTRLEPAQFIMLQRNLKDLSPSSCVADLLQDPG
jgi:hypothetical protein